MNAGLIDESEARRRRQAIGARGGVLWRDGWRGALTRDSLATILITAINIVAGLLIGTLQQGVELSGSCTHVYRADGGGRAGYFDSVVAGVDCGGNHADACELGGTVGGRNSSAAAG